jgi:hypothetical protein
MKKIMSAFFALSLVLTFLSIGSGSALAIPPTEVEIYPVNFDGSVIYNKVFTVTPAMPNGATSFTNGSSDRATVYVVSNSCHPLARCFKKNITYTISGGSCFNRWQVKFLTGYNWTTEPSVIFSELYDGNEGFQISGGSQFLSGLLPMTSPFPCG